MEADWGSHLGTLKEMLPRTTGTIVELGIGYGSTPFLHQYAEEHGRQLISVEDNDAWLFKVSAEFATPWHQFYFDPSFSIPGEPGLVLVDQGSAGLRSRSVRDGLDLAQIIVVHDTEPTLMFYPGWADTRTFTRIAPAYPGMEEALSSAKYRLDVMDVFPWTTAVSNIVDVTASS